MDICGCSCFTWLITACRSGTEVAATLFLTRCSPRLTVHKSASRVGHFRFKGLGRRWLDWRKGSLPSGLIFLSPTRYQAGGQVVFATDLCRSLLAACQLTYT